MDRLNDAIIASQLGATIDPFQYVINFAPALLSVVTVGQFTVQGDSAFCICETMYVVTDTSNAAVAELQPFGSGLTTGFAPFLVTLSDSGAGRSLSNTAVPIDNLFGTAIRPYNWPTPKVLDPNSAFVAAVQNLSATSRNLRLTFGGYKVFGNIAAFVAKLRVQ